MNRYLPIFKKIPENFVKNKNGDKATLPVDTTERFDVLATLEYQASNSRYHERGSLQGLDSRKDEVLTDGKNELIIENKSIISFKGDKKMVKKEKQIMKDKEIKIKPIEKNFYLIQDKSMLVKELPKEGGCSTSEVEQQKNKPIYKSSLGKRYTYTPEGKGREENIPSDAFSSIPIFENFREIYTVEDREDQILGKGSFAVAYKIYDSKQCYALKKLKKPGNAQCRDMFFREIAIMDHLKRYLLDQDQTVQKRFVKYYETFLYKAVSTSTRYTLRLGMRLEFLNGIDLKNYLIYKKVKEGKRMKIDNVLYIIRELLEALLYLEKAKVVHRDIKPDNIMVVHDGNKIQRLVLIDFGIGAILEPSMKLSTSGTPNYMAHELIDCDDVKRLIIRYDICRYYLMADLFSVGVIFYKLLSSNDSFPYKTYRQNNKIMRDIRYKELNCGYECVDKLVYNMVHSDYTKRYNVTQSIEALNLCINNIIQITIDKINPGTRLIKDLCNENKTSPNTSPRKSIRSPDYEDRLTETYKHSGKSIGSGRIEDIGNGGKDIIGSDEDEIEEYDPNRK